MDTFLRRTSDLNRRDFLAISAKSFLGLGLLGTAEHSLAAAEMSVVGKPTARKVIYLYMAGGMSHLDTFDTKPNTDQQGPVASIRSNVPGIHVSEYFPHVSHLMDKVAVINSMSSTQGAHEQGNYFMHASYKKRGTIRHPGMGAWLLKLQGKTNRTLPGYVRIGGGSQGVGAGFLDSTCEPLVLSNPKQGLKNSRRKGGLTEKEFEDRMLLLDEFDQKFHQRYDMKKVRAYPDMYREAVKLMKSEDLASFDINQEPRQIREAYGDNSFGQGCLLARRLVENDVRFVEVTLGGWDTHQDNFVNLPSKAKILDQALGALLNDLTVRGMLEETLVVLATEFGRTPDINQNQGRDHYPRAFTCLLAGGGVAGGQVYGKTDEKGANVVENKLSVPDFNATIAYALGLPLEQVVHSDTRRPFTVADKGKPVVELFA